MQKFTLKKTKAGKVQVWDETGKSIILNPPFENAEFYSLLQEQYPELPPFNPDSITVFETAKNKPYLDLKDFTKLLDDLDPTVPTIQKRVKGSKTKSTVKKVTDTVQNFLEELGGANIPIVVAESLNDLMLKAGVPAEIHQAILQGEINEDTGGFVYKGKVYLIAHNIADSVQEIISTFKHELIGHAILEALWDSGVRSETKDLARLKTIVDRAIEGSNNELKDAIKTVQARYKDNTEKEQLKEIIAFLAEKHSDSSLFSVIVNYIKEVVASLLGKYVNKSFLNAADDAYLKRLLTTSLRNKNNKHFKTSSRKILIYLFY